MRGYCSGAVQKRHSGSVEAMAACRMGDLDRLQGRPARSTPSPHAAERLGRSCEQAFRLESRGARLSPRTLGIRASRPPRRAGRPSYKLPSLRHRLRIGNSEPSAASLRSCVRPACGVAAPRGKPRLLARPPPCKTVKPAPFTPEKFSDALHRGHFGGFGKNSHPTGGAQVLLEKNSHPTGHALPLFFAEGLAGGEAQ